MEINNVTMCRGSFFGPKAFDMCMLKLGHKINAPIDIVSLYIIKIDCYKGQDSIKKKNLIRGFVIN